MKKAYLSLFLTSFLMSIAVLSYSQNKAQIQIRKNQNGVKSEETREIELSDGQKIEDILMEMGVLDELGQLKEGQEIEIRIDKTDKNQDFENLEFLFDSGTQDLGELPEFAPAMPMELKPFLGVMLKENESFPENEKSSSGVSVTEVIENSEAEKAGLLAGDIILKIDDTDMNSVTSAIEYIQSKNIDDKIELLVIREGKKKKIKAQLGSKEMSPAFNFNFPNLDNIMKFPDGSNNFNFRFGPDSITIFCPQTPNCICPNDSMKIGQPFSWNGEGMTNVETAFLGVTPADFHTEKGVKINVEKETSAERMGLTDGDVIIEINGTVINSFDELADMVEKSKPGDTIQLVIERDGKRKEISGELGKRSMSGFDDFRIFHDYKGMDEGGNYFYDYEFDMDAENIEQRMQELLEDLDRQQGLIDEERDRIEEELDRLHENTDIVIIKIQIAEITPEEVEIANKIATPKIEISNNLQIEQISFYPNPNDGILNLSFVTTETRPIKVILYNSSGEIVYLEERSSFDGKYNKTIDVSDEPNGSYFLQILQDGKSYSKKIVKGL